MTPRERRGQSGYTFIELLIVVAISSVILVPLLAWVTLAIQRQPITRDGLVRSADTGLLAAYLPEDIAIAGAAAVDGSPVPAAGVSVGLDDCSGGDGQAAGDAVLAVLVGGDDPTKIVYTEAATVEGGAPDPTRMSVWRRECSPDTGADTTAVQVFTDVLPGSTEATCDSPAGESPCQQVRFATQPLAGGDPIVTNATRRTDTESLSVDATGNRLPVARIDVLNQVAAGGAVTVDLSAAASIDPDGSIVAYRWAIPTLPEGTPGGTAPEIVEVAPGDEGTPLTRTFPGVGRYHVTLTVTDDRGATNTTYRRITVEPRSPTAVAAVTPTSGGPGQVFTFTGSGSTDPDGSIASYRWVLGGDETSAGISYVVDQADWDFTFPEYVSGPIPVTLTVTDDQGRTSTTLTGVVVEPPVPDPGPDPLPGEEPPPSTVPGGPVAVFAATGGGSPAQWSVDAIGVHADRLDRVLRVGLRRTRPDRIGVHGVAHLRLAGELHRPAHRHRRRRAPVERGPLHHGAGRARGPRGADPTGLRPRVVAGSGGSSVLRRLRVHRQRVRTRDPRPGDRGRAGAVEGDPAEPLRRRVDGTGPLLRRGERPARGVAVDRREHPGGPGCRRPR